ncbi:MAG: hypothetical protein HC819_05135 [Cyclobacteriaceae bacterium]|nr:hypothetical protein [Cyclobacteriaceae bacterium]
MKVLSLAWKYHPSITSGVGVACEGINKALSNLVDLKVIYPKVNKVQLREEVLLGSEDLSIEQKKLLKKNIFIYKKTEVSNWRYPLILIIPQVKAIMKTAQYTIRARAPWR